jgi:hypothetical protein
MDKERLLRRTQTKRSVYRVLGKPEPVAQPVPESLSGELVRNLMQCDFGDQFLGGELNEKLVGTTS